MIINRFRGANPFLGFLYIPLVALIVLKFPVIPVMEDYQFSLTLKEMGVRLGMAKRRIYTSDRRFPKGTIPKLKLMWKMNRLRKMYRDHVPIEKIDRLYQDVR